MDDQTLRVAEVRDPGAFERLTSSAVALLVATSLGELVALVLQWRELAG